MIRTAIYSLGKGYTIQSDSHIIYTAGTIRTANEKTTGHNLTERRIGQCQLNIPLSGCRTTAVGERTAGKPILERSILNRCVSSTDSGGTGTCLIDTTCYNCAELTTIDIES